MRVLLDLQALQTQGAADRGVGIYTNGLLKALASRHEVVGLRRAGAFIVDPSVEVRMISAPDWESLDVAINCSGPFWQENAIVSDGRLVASIFYDAIPWVFPDQYLPGASARQRYHNRCVELYAKADLVCGISESASADALRFGYATGDTVATISTGRDPLACESRSARETWSIERPYVLTVSGGDYRKNPGTLVEGYLKSRLRQTHDLVLVISNDAQGGFSKRLGARRGVHVLPQVEEGALGALYRDCEAFVYASLYEGFGIPVLEAMQAGKWIIAPTSSSIGEVAGAALLETIADPRDPAAIAAALDRAAERLARQTPDPSVPLAQAGQFTWSRVAEKLEAALEKRRQSGVARPAKKPTLYWASPFPADKSGVAFYSSDLAPFVGRQFDVVLMPNDCSSFVPSAATGRFRLARPDFAELAAASGGELPLIFYHIGNSPFHLELLALLLKVPGVVLLHDTVVSGLTAFWNERAVRSMLDPYRHSALSYKLRLWLARLGNLDRLLEPQQPTGPRRVLARLARRPAPAALVSLIARSARLVIPQAAHLPLQMAPRISRPDEIAARIVQSSRAMVLLCEHAKSFLPQDELRTRPQHVVPLYARPRHRITGAEKAALRRKYGVPQDAFVVTTTGFQAPINLTHRVAGACLELHRVDKAPVYLQVLGELAPRAYRDRVHALLDGSAMGRFLSDEFIDEATLVERTALSDVAVFLRAQSNGGPSAGLNDALGLGLPSLATDDFAFREYPQGAFRAIANEALADELRSLYRDAAAREALAAAGLRFAQDYGPARVAERLCGTLARYSASGAPEAPVRAAASGGRLFVDVTFGLGQRRRSGLQRVEREIAGALGAGGRVAFVAWSANTRRFHDVGADAVARRESLPALESWLAGRQAAKIERGDNLFLLASNWPLGDEYYDDLLALERRGVRLSALVPDLIPLRHRDEFYSDHARGSTIDRFAAYCRKVLPACSDILAISNYVALDLHRLLLCEQDGARTRPVPKVHVIRLGADWATPFGQGEAPAALAIPGPFVLCVGTLEKRKNHWRLFAAFSQARRNVPQARLVLVGAFDGFYTGALRDYLRRNRWIHHFESADDALLGRLYAECSFTVYPSLAEGYGLPVVESFRHGKVCIASRAEAIPEAGGEYADYFDPLDPREMAQKLIAYLADPAALARRARALDAYRPVRWQDTTRQVARILGVADEAVAA